jgi:FkbM family methyltransferase
MNMLDRLAQTLRAPLLPLLREAPDLTYVDCGARAESENPLVELFPKGRYIGFEPDAEECQRLNAAAKAKYRFHPVALSGATGEMPFHVTRNPACSSLYAPDPQSLADYEGVDGVLDPQRTILLPTMTLDDFLRSLEVSEIDCLELDTQGSELDILKGSQAFLDDSILAVKVEVEFVPQYHQQPLFGQVDAFLREHRFALFALSPRSLRWKGLPREIASDGQLLWGHGVYLKRPEALPARVAPHVRLAVIACCLGVPDYAQAVLARGADRLAGRDRDGADRLADLRTRLLEALPRTSSPAPSRETALTPGWKQTLGRMRQALHRFGR